MHSTVASFYGGYDLVVHARPTHRRVRPVFVLLAVAALVLLVFIAADVSAFQALPVAVHVTAVEWFAGTELLTSTGGFTMPSSQSVTLTLTCNFICYEITSATVSAPFHLAGFVVNYAPIQYVNVTAPSGSFTGPLVITLS
ncbi:MAG TPA: hypothetical protein VK424_01470 [Thermoplasmata archaeon]|nr:hypothetical protein [Thermoplasmata archaeon]